MSVKEATEKALIWSTSARNWSPSDWTFRCGKNLWFVTPAYWGSVVPRIITVHFSVEYDIKAFHVSSRWVKTAPWQDTLLRAPEYSEATVEICRFLGLILTWNTFEFMDYLWDISYEVGDSFLVTKSLIELFWLPHKEILHSLCAVKRVSLAAGHGQRYQQAGGSWGAGRRRWCLQAGRYPGSYTKLHEHKAALVPFTRDVRGADAYYKWRISSVSG